MSPELEKAYRDASRPFVDGAITEAATQKRSWRYFFEINSMCNLHCVTCTKGNTEGYEHKNGVMDWDLMLRCLDKIQSENPEAIVFLYGNSEPFLHPKLPEVIREVQVRGLRCEFSTNLNYTRRADEVLDAKPDFVIVSVSGFTQPIYERGHCGGDIERVKSNMRVIGTLNAMRSPKVDINVNYHIYKYNEHELPLMRAYAESVGLGLFTSFARIISMENAIQLCREGDPERTEFEYEQAFPPTTVHFREIVEQLKIPPQKAREMYAHLPESPVCPIGAGGMFTFIRHDGKTSMCPCVADRRLTVSDYLSASPEQMLEERAGHAVCKQCMRYKLSYYFHLVDRTAWGSA